MSSSTKCSLPEGRRYPPFGLSNVSYDRFFLLSLSLSFPLGVTRPREKPSKNDADKKGTQEHKRSGDGGFPYEELNLDNLGILDGKDDDQDG